MPTREEIESASTYCDCGGRLRVDDHEKREMYCDTCGISFIYPMMSCLASTRKQVREERARITGFFTKLWYSDESHYENRRY